MGQISEKQHLFSCLTALITSECSRNSRTDSHERGSARLPWNVTIFKPDGIVRRSVC